MVSPMRKLVAVLALVACGSTEELEKKVEKLEKDVSSLQEQRAALEKKFNKLTGDLSDQRALDAKIDMLMKSQQKTMDALSTRAVARTRREPDRAKTYAIPVDNAPSVGPADAKVTMVWAYDYACPFCERVRTTIGELRTRYGSDLRVVYKQFVVHPANATAAAYAACAANKQRRFTQMDEQLWDKGFKERKYDLTSSSTSFGSLPCWEESAGCPIVLDFARKVGLDTYKFKTDMKICAAEVKEQHSKLTEFGVGATPSFFINGRFLAGAMPMENFQQIVDEEMKKANEKIQAGTPQAKYYDEWVINKGLKTLEAPKQ